MQNHPDTPLNNPLWPFPFHNGERTAASAALLKPELNEGSFSLGLQLTVESRHRVTDTNQEEEALF